MLEVYLYIWHVSDEIIKYSLKKIHHGKWKFQILCCWHHNPDTRNTFIGTVHTHPLIFFFFFFFVFCFFVKAIDPILILKKYITNERFQAFQNGTLCQSETCFRMAHFLAENCNKLCTVQIQLNPNAFRNYSFWCFLIMKNITSSRDRIIDHIAL